MSTEDWLKKKHFYYPSTIIACGGCMDDFDEALGSGLDYAKNFDKVFTFLRSEITCDDCYRAIVANAADCLPCRDFVMFRRDTSNHTCDPTLDIKRTK